MEYLTRHLSNVGRFKIYSYISPIDDDLDPNIIRSLEMFVRRPVQDVMNLVMFGYIFAKLERKENK
jgi:hypothetical protein